MAISTTLGNYLAQNGIDYDLIPHPRTYDSMHTAQQAHIPGDRLAKAVIVQDGGEYTMVVVPSDEHVDLARIRRIVGESVELTSEADLSRLFPDCALGAVPPTGAAWGLDTYLDESLLGLPEVYFEAGDHEELVRVSGDSFEQLLKDADRGHYGQTI